MCRIDSTRNLGSLASGCALLLFASELVLLAGCRQQMADQPRHDPLSASSFFADGRSARPLVEGAVAYGTLEEDFLHVSATTEAFPIPVTEELLARGQERFNIFCSVCHGLLGDGNGMIPRRGFRHPPSYHSDRLRNAPVGHFYDVITNGFGAMPDYASQVPPRDRWAIIAYLRALQLSQHISASELQPADRGRLGPGGAP
ncbi:MAG: cytochrome c [Acidobacteria bacterium]|nr:cytochrome c [Acidobacteriota bacterium]